MPPTPHDECAHGRVQPLGLTDRIPPAWLQGVRLPNDGAQHESAWCMACERYVWRELGSTYWTPLDPPA